jgi:hypothetical protein
MAKALGITKYKGVYDFDLDQFGIYKNNNETILEALDRVLKSDFLSHNDNAFEDLTIDKALSINRTSRCRRASITSRITAAGRTSLRSRAAACPTAGCGSR